MLDSPVGMPYSIHLVPGFFQHMRLLMPSWARPMYFSHMQCISNIQPHVLPTCSQEKNHVSEKSMLVFWFYSGIDW